MGAFHKDLWDAFFIILVLKNMQEIMQKTRCKKRKNCYNKNCLNFLSNDEAKWGKRLWQIQMIY